MPTSMTVVATSTWTSRAANARIVARPSGRLLPAVHEPDA